MFQALPHVRHVLILMKLVSHHLRRSPNEPPVLPIINNNSNHLLPTTMTCPCPRVMPSRTHLQKVPHLLCLPMLNPCPTTMTHPLRPKIEPASRIHRIGVACCKDLMTSPFLLDRHLGNRHLRLLTTISRSEASLHHRSRTTTPHASWSTQRPSWRLTNPPMNWKRRATPRWSGCPIRCLSPWWPSLLKICLPWVLHRYHRPEERPSRQPLWHSRMSWPCQTRRWAWTISSSAPF